MSKPRKPKVELAPETTPAGLWWEEGLEEKWEADAKDAIPPDIVWRSADGRSIPVVDLEDVHLMNIIKYIARTDDERTRYLARDALDQRTTSAKKWSRRELLNMAFPALPYLEKEATRRGYKPTPIIDAQPPASRESLAAKVYAADAALRALVGLPDEIEALDKTSRPRRYKPKSRAKPPPEPPDARPIEVRRFAMLELPDFDDK